MHYFFGASASTPGLLCLYRGGCHEGEIDLQGFTTLGVGGEFLITAASDAYKGAVGSLTTVAVKKHPLIFKYTFEFVETSIK